MLTRVDRQPVGDSSSACALEASSLPFRQPERRSHVGLPPKRGACRAERTCDDEAVSGRAPPRPGTRLDLPIAVTLSTTLSAFDVSPPTTGTPVSAIPVELEHVVQLRVVRGGEVDEQSFRLCAGCGEVAEIELLARQPRSRARDPVAAEVIPSTSASCVTTSPSRSSAASSPMLLARPRFSSSASRPSSPSSKSRIDSPPSPSPRRAPRG